MSEPLKDYLPAGSNPHALARAEETELGRILIHASKVETDKRREQYERNPKQGTERVKDDFRFKLGEVEGLKFLGRLIRDAKEAVARGQR